MPKALRQRNSNDKKNPDQGSKKRKAVEGRKDKSAASQKAKRPTVKPPRPPAHQKEMAYAGQEKRMAQFAMKNGPKTSSYPIADITC